jgi:hypothetical protein
MAVYTYHEALSEGTIERYREQAANAKSETGWLSKAYYLQAIDEGTFDPARDELVRTWDDKVTAYKRLNVDSVGATVKIDERYTYYGDGDGWYSATAIIAKDGEYVAVNCGSGGYTRVDLLGSTVDAPQGVIDAYEAHKANEERLAKIRIYNRFDAYKVERGALAYVSRGRKAKGRSGVIFWVGENRWGTSVGIEDDGGDRFFTAVYNVDVVPEPDVDDEGVKCAQCGAEVEGTFCTTCGAMV